MSMLSVRFSERVKRKLLGYEPDAFRQLFLQRMDILDALDEGLMAIDEHSMITYMNRAAADILKIKVKDALGQPLQTVYPRSTMARVLQTGKSEYNIGLESIKHVSVISDRMRDPVTYYHFILATVCRSGGTARWRELSLFSATGPRSRGWRRI